MTELQILEKIVNTISGDNSFTIKMFTKEQEPAQSDYDKRLGRKHIPVHKYTLSIKNGRKVIAGIERTLDQSTADKVAANHDGVVYNELALQLIINMACKGIDKIK